MKTSACGQSTLVLQMYGNDVEAKIAIPLSIKTENKTINCCEFSLFVHCEIRTNQSTFLYLFIPLKCYFKTIPMQTRWKSAFFGDFKNFTYFRLCVENFWTDVSLEYFISLIFFSMEVDLTFFFL